MRARVAKYLPRTTFHTASLGTRANKLEKWTVCWIRRLRCGCMVPSSCEAAKGRSASVSGKQQRGHPALDKGRLQRQLPRRRGRTHCTGYLRSRGRSGIPAWHLWVQARHGVGTHLQLRRSLRHRGHHSRGREGGGSHDPEGHPHWLSKG